MVVHGDGVLEVLEGRLKVVPPVDGDQHGDRVAAVGHDQRVVAEIGEFVANAVA
jgi:hypothetical protein